MKIVYLTASFPFGKGEAFFIPEIEELRAQGNELVLVPLHPRGPLLHQDANPLLSITVMERLLSVRILADALLQAFGHPVRTGLAAATLLQSRSTRIAIKNASVLLKSLWLARYVSISGTEHIHAQWGGCTATAAMIASRISGIPWSFTVHSWELVENNLLDVKARNASFVRVVSQFGKSRLQRRTSAQVDLLHLGIRLPDSPNPAARTAGSTFRLVVVASLIEIKGHKYLFEAWSKLRDRGIVVNIDIVGEGGLREDLEQFVAQAGASDHIRFHGMIPHDVLLSQMSADIWDAVALPSIVDQASQQEGIPVSLMEAMARQLPVISTETGGIPELLGDGAGLLVPERDSTALADAIEQLASNPSLRRKLALAGRKRVEESFDVTVIVDRLAKLMQDGYKVRSVHTASAV
jgi:glycosyltransferase involved in cell wall biosynthesis